MRYKDKALRTYRDLMAMTEPGHHQTCCVCHRWPSDIGRMTLDRKDAGDMFQLGIRAHICRECCEKKGDQVLGSVVKAERSARDWVKHHPSVRNDPKWIAGMTGASLEFVQAEIAKVQAL